MYNVAWAITFSGVPITSRDQREKISPITAIATPLISASAIDV